MILNIWDGLGYEFGVGTYIPITHLVPMFWREKPKLISKLSQSGENPSNWIWFGCVPVGMSFVAMPNHNIMETLVDNSDLRVKGNWMKLFYGGWPVDGYRHGIASKQEVFNVVTGVWCVRDRMRMIDMFSSVVMRCKQ